MEAAGLKKHLTEQRMSHGHGEPEPAARFVVMLHVRRSRRQPFGQWHLHPPSIAEPAEVEVVPAAHKVESAARLIHSQRHTQARGQLLYERAIWLDHLGGSYEAGSRARPAIL